MTHGTQIHLVAAGGHESFGPNRASDAMSRKSKRMLPHVRTLLVRWLGIHSGGKVQPPSPAPPRAHPMTEVPHTHQPSHLMNPETEHLQLVSTSRRGDGFTAPYHFTLHLSNPGDHWATHATNEQPTDHHTGHYFETFTEGLRDLHQRATADGLAIDWNSSRLHVGDVVTVANETKHGNDLHTFLDAATHDAYRHDQLRCYYHEASTDDSGEVLALLAAGQLDEAWDMAHDDPDKELWDTTFGNHVTHTTPMLIPLSALPAWLLDPLKASLEEPQS